LKQCRITVAFGQKSLCDDRFSPKADLRQPHPKHRSNKQKMLLRRLLWVALAIGALVSIAIAGLLYRGQELRAATGFISHTLCSGVFVSGLGAEQVYAKTVQPLVGLQDLDWAIRYQVNKQRREVKASFRGIFERNARATDGLGCLLEIEDSSATIRPSVPRDMRELAASRVLPSIGPSSVVEPADGRLQEALDRTFAEFEKPPYRQTAAAVVVRDGRIVAERYAPGYGVDTPLLGWSVTKSVVNALIGILVREGRLSVNGPAPVPRWRSSSDQRHSISIDMLMRMTSGLDISETNRVYDTVARMLLNERDMARFAAEARLTSSPGQVWYYTSGNTLILSQIIREAVGGQLNDVLQFAHRELIDPLGMETVTLEFDSVGTPIGSTYMYASARDWTRFGMLYVDDGVVGGRRILPEGWVRYSSSQTLDSPYAAGFWRGTTGLRRRWKLPEDAFFASGFLGQRIMVIPSERLVITRFGNAHNANADLEGFMQLVADVRAAGVNFH
jgi:CubicO group peptidase (beta-lactamase class C family)